MSAPRAESSSADRTFMVTWGVAEEFGGMTAVCLQRARMFRDHADVHTPVLTFEPRPGYATVLAALEKSGHAFDGLEIRNIYHYYRAASLEERTARPAPEPLASYRRWNVVIRKQQDDDGRAFCRTTTLRGTDTVVQREYLRTDGTPFLRDESPVDEEGQLTQRRLMLLTRDGRAVGEWARAGDFYRQWLLELSGGERTAMIVDSIYVARTLSSLEASNIVKLGVLHNSHVKAGKDPFTGPIGQPQRAIVDNPSHWDGVVFLTEGQHEDYVARFGGADNLFVISNARERLTKAPPVDGRKNSTGVMVCQLSQRKNVASAVRIIHRASQSVPDVHLDVYGGGPQMDDLRETVNELGMQENVTLHGHTPQASRFFETATFSLLTSHKEGQPLVLMESLGRGCPPISYDIRYGPGSLVQDGVNGFLVAHGDEEEAAGRVVQVCRDAELARTLSTAAWHSSERFGERAILGEWQRAVDRAFAMKADRLLIRDAAFTTSSMTAHGSGVLEIEGEVTWENVLGETPQEVIVPQVVVRRRKTGAPDIFPVEVVARGPGRLSVRLRLTQGEVGDHVPSGNGQLDLVLALVGRNLVKHIRIEYGNSSVPWLPYATTHGSLSLQRRDRRTEER